MVSLSELPTEIIQIIIGLLRKHWSPWSTATRNSNQQAILPFSQTNRLLWRIARPFLYENIEIRVDTNHWEKLPRPYKLKLQTSLLCRALQEDPLLTSYVRMLQLKGFMYQVYTSSHTPPGRAALYSSQPSTISYTAPELASLLASCTNTRFLIVHGILRADPLSETNILILSCLKSMIRLEVLELYVDSETGPNVVLHLLNAVSIKLKELDIGPQHEDPGHDITKWPLDCVSLPTSRCELKTLTIPADKLPWAAFRTWVSSLQILYINDIVLSDGRTNQGLDIYTILSPIALTLVYLHLSIHPLFDAPSLSDFDMSQCVALESFSYKGPWWIRSKHTPIDVCQTLFSRSYKSLVIEERTWRHRHKAKVNALRVLAQAVELAHLQNRCPDSFELELDFTEVYSTDNCYDLESELENLAEGLRERGIAVDWGVNV
jgi:hypothetical protein